MIKKKTFLLSTLLLCITLSACSVKTSSPTVKAENVKPKPSSETTNELVSPYTGETASQASLTNIPIMVIIENSPQARPQSGLSKADIVYETMAEGGIPRFIALFQKNNVEKIGPVRSARPYFLDITKEYNLPFAHCGGSQEAYDKIANEKMMSMNEINYGDKYYWRDTSRKAPHNLYTSTEKISALATKLGYTNMPQNVKLTFDNSYWKNGTFDKASTVFIQPNKGYNTSYTYKNESYYKSMDNVLSVDMNTKNPICAKNIVIQFTKITVLPDEAHHLVIDLVGNGDGYLISGGKFIKIKWSKADLNSQTKLTDENGNPVPLSIGNTWWHIVDSSTTVNIKAQE